MANLRRGGRGAAGRSRTLGVADPRGRRSAQVHRLESYQVDGRFLTLDGRGRLTTNPALRAAIPALTPLSPDAALLDGSDTGTEIALAVNALRARIQELESRSAAQLATIEALQARLVDVGVMK